MHYVYIHRKASNGDIFYVGKGSGNRAQSVAPRSDWWNRVKNKHGFKHEIVKEFEHEVCALTYERIMICELRKTCDLVNITDGGEGTSGRPMSDHTKRRIKETLSRPVVSDKYGEFDSITDAVRFLQENGKPKAHTAGICLVAKGKQRTAYGSKWAYIVDGEPQWNQISDYENRGRHSAKPVKCSNGMIFNSTLGATAWLRENVNPRAVNSGISKCARGERETSYGYNWQYLTQ